MNRSAAAATSVQALRLGIDATRVLRFALPVTVEPETLVLRAAVDGPAPLLLCLHPARMSEFQFALRLRDLAQAPIHVAFPRGLHAHEVDLGGAVTVGYAWCHYTGDNPAFRESLAGAMTYLDRVSAHLHERLAVRRDAVFVLGAEDASLPALVYAVGRSDEIAGAVAIGGRVLTEIVAERAAGPRSPRFLCIDDRVPRARRRVPRRRGGRRAGPDRGAAPGGTGRGLHRHPRGGGALAGRGRARDRLADAGHAGQSPRAGRLRARVASSCRSGSCG
jgi:hypothetical protein